MAQCYFTQELRAALTDYVCAKLFELMYATKTWQAVYEGCVLVSAPQKMSLAHGSDCCAHREKKTKAPADRSHPIAIKRASETGKHNHISRTHVNEHPAGMWRGL